MAQPVVVEVPQWQGSSSPAAWRLRDGCRSLAGLLPVTRRIRTEVTDAGAPDGTWSVGDAGGGAGTGGADGRTTDRVRALDALTANLAAVRAALADAAAHADPPGGAVGACAGRTDTSAPPAEACVGPAGGCVSLADASTDPVGPSTDRTGEAAGPAGAFTTPGEETTDSPDVATGPGNVCAGPADTLSGRTDAVLLVTVGGDCGVELAPVERAHQQYGDRLAVVWCDAHADLNTPGSSPSGAFHGMVLRTLLGEGPEPLRCAAPLAPGQVVLAGVRSLDGAEERYVAEQRVRHLGVTEPADPGALVEAVAATGAEAVYVHIDLDVLDPGVFSSVGVPEPHGLTPHRLADAVRALTERFTVAGLGLTEHQPAEGAAERAAGTQVLGGLVRTLTDLVAGPHPEDVRRIERHALDAWPAPRCCSENGWLLRHIPGMRRLRSGNTALPLPLSPGGDEKDGGGAEGATVRTDALAEVEAFYAGRGLPAAVQVSPTARHIALDEQLAARGYVHGEAIQVLTAPTDAVARPPGPAARPADGWRIEVERSVTRHWLEAFVALDGKEDACVLLPVEVVSRIKLPVATVTVCAPDRRTAGVGLFVGGDERWAGVYCMVTHPGLRRRGTGAAVLRAGAGWAAGQHVPGLCLQVGGADAGARALYARAGFGHAYGYHYRLRKIPHGGSVAGASATRVTVR